ncbi:hypothetical protein AUEXF2481DRAFT_44158 [Aureobasidium subglaciale EXF-2481]|uniref:E3 ubiquitin-protein ligase listerin n=1 Tax=Aureobasidium subglaciale (strain EXF-2481) TaxID=1043005 RepID=A0A074Y0M4_AURSE|nr:uncharacterized protein AUEXF2481DRAFT_44158 [Aureobasidium subglaciale EXF-2481]KAI5206537.1 hypothetical protein E4T38_03687 [Aureobasidium subglaciale]KAI5224936.1 hypothetical protein E4T41_05435 [Aureobasidium subglaciale]KAI5225449.1 hypothetical protein E4T40_03462 [Aureobasidium subglaciale]KAI5261126.1 hypothetical protein E4T46_05328 [Aureobasidium subglaciale]KEQ91348.1 hypothetical protein AUEXF2481DRAFT_44158 [Aureobasidium subglaciale EXF-2481]
MKKAFRPQASSARSFGGSGFGGGFGVSSSPLSWIGEPPDLSNISDPNVGVAFKNLTKKDSTTKAKALEELLAYVSAPGQQIEEPVLEAWVKLYPRLSIDSARRVRQLAHNVLGHIATKSGKRMVKHMSRIAGPWLAGAQDSDRAASRAAQDALKLVFNSPEKLQNLSKAFQQPILEHCRDALLNETIQTLSDERSVSPADAQATYSRVVATSIAVISNLLTDLAPEEVAKQQETYEGIIGQSNIWNLASYKEDVVVRRFIHRFLRTCLAKQKAAVEANLSTISEAYISKALPHDQTGSSYDFMLALVELTDALPRAWTTSYTSKKPAGTRLRGCIKRGSQAGPADFWTNAWLLFSKLPAEILPQKYSEAEELLTAVHDGVCQKDDRFNASAAWFTYFKVLDLVQNTASLSDDEHETLLSKMAIPAIEQYLRPSPSTANWQISGAKPAWNVSKAAFCKRLPSVLEKKWPEYAALLVEDIRTSLPEQAKDFEKSQAHVASAAERWALLQSELLRDEYQLSEALRTIFSQSAKDVVNASLEALRNRNGKPYGAAAAIDELQNHCKTLLEEDRETQDIVATFVVQDLPGLLSSPSQKQLVSLLYHFQTDSRFGEAWNKAATALGNSQDSDEKLNAFRDLLASPRVKPAAELAAQNGEIQAFLQRQFKSSLDTGAQWSFISSIIKGTPSVASTETVDSMLADLTTSLSIFGKANSALDGLQEITKSNKTLVKEHIKKPSGSQLLPNLLLLEESTDESLAAKASSISKGIVTEADKSGSQTILFDVVHQSLRDVSSSSLPMPQVLDMAASLVKDGDVDQKKQEVAKQALPDLAAWNAAIAPFIGTAPPIALAITSVLGGATYLVDPESRSDVSKISRDADGLSQALRFAMYTSRIYSSRALLQALEPSTQTELFRLFYLTHILLTESVSLKAQNGLASSNPETEAEIVEFINEANKLIGDCFQQYEDASDASYAFVGTIVDDFFEKSKGSSTSAFYHAQALSHALSDLESIHGGGHAKIQEYEDKTVQLYKAKEVVPFTACANGLKEALSDSKKLDRQTNELVADLTGLDALHNPEKAITQLVMLNALFSASKQADSVVAKQRLIFLMKHILPWLDNDEIVTPIKVETCKTLLSVLPGVSDIYGEHWSQVLAFMTYTWELGFVRDEIADESRMALVYTSLQLSSTLRSLKSGEEPNDDLVDAWKDSSEVAYMGLMNLVRQGQGQSDEHHEPLKMLFQALGIEVAQWSTGQVEDEAELYPLLYTPSEALQKTAFDILHRVIPAAQEKVSFDAALEKKAAKLPEELLSLLLAPPTLDSLADASFRTGIPQELQAYLYGWQLVFDHFVNSSYQVKSDYVEALREGEYLGHLLELTWELLGHVRGRPIDVSKYDIRRYDYLDQQGDFEGLSADKRMHWLLAHLYYQALMHVPSLTKGQFLAIKSRQTGLAVESWTAKYIAPLIVSATLDSVQQWADAVKTDPEYEGWSVKVSPRSREVQFSYLVDEQTMSIVIRLPETYPLASARVEGLNRVAADERKWQSWLRNCQGVIQFSNGNLIDGLTTWRRNVTGALKGQSECAICYSIISGDRQLPSKRCSTCKNLFHSSCLFKWFKTSNASTCPLCRNPFNYG